MKEGAQRVVGARASGILLSAVKLFPKNDSEASFTLPQQYDCLNKT